MRIRDGYADTTAGDYQEEYWAAVTGYYDVSTEAVTAAVEAGIPNEELPVLFCVATKAKVNPQGLIASRTGGQSWMSIATSNGLTANDFYVQVDGKVIGAQYGQTYAKFKGLKRSEFGQIQLTDADIVHLVNLRLIYHHYNYSQHLVMTWISEGTSFLEVNHMVYSVTAEMEQKKRAEEE